MTKLLTCIGVVIFTLMVCVHSEFIDPPPSAALRSFSDTQTRLPCRYVVEGEEKVVQVTWSRQKPGGEKEQIIIGHFTEGPKASPDFLKRVQFESSEPTVDSTLLILNTKKADQATYTCHISTFPSGNFERQISLTVWSLPISSLDPVILQEGQSFRVAASCRSVGHPPPRLSWDTEIPGQSQNRSGEDGVVTSQFYLHPLRSMNGRRLDCLVWHPALDGPRRISNQLIVHFPPDAEIVSSGSWRIGHTGSELRCAVKGNPLPQNVTWSRKDGHLPEGVLVQRDRLLFVRPLNVSDEGLYVCQTGNSVGTAKAQFKLEIGNANDVAQAIKNPSETLLIIIGVSVAGALVVVMVITIIIVNCHLRRKNRKLKRALSARTEEMISLSRQVSMRRLNSINSDPRTAAEEGSLMRMDSVMKNSVLSVEDHSTLRDGEYDSLGRPAIYPSYRPDRGIKKLRDIEEDERSERRRRVESYVKSSNMSLVCDSGLHRDQSSPPRSVSSGPTEAWKRGSRREIHRDEHDAYVQQERIPEGEEGNNYHLSEAVSNYFQCSNGGLTPKENPNAIIIHSRRQII
ncbi:nectin-4 isoform X2 [Ctenopharyngodon idella]|uniref:nectin-4 isoform X2 n=1 Tax=Ctenopharyngodon idella TaxID=7959 RepID=UPI0022323941|nr:nectin-4 isoform X2 [Ctenopharyngodon idella]